MSQAPETPDEMQGQTSGGQDKGAAPETPSKVQGGTPAQTSPGSEGAVRAGAKAPAPRPTMDIQIGRAHV